MNNFLVSNTSRLNPDLSDLKLLEQTHNKNALQETASRQLEDMRALASQRIQQAVQQQIKYYSSSDETNNHSNSTKRVQQFVHDQLTEITKLLESTFQPFVGFQQLNEIEDSKPVSTMDAMDAMDMFLAILYEYREYYYVLIESVQQKQIEQLSAAITELKTLWDQVMLIALESVDPNDINKRADFGSSEIQELFKKMEEQLVLLGYPENVDISDVISVSDPNYMELEQLEAQIYNVCDKAQLEVDSLITDMEANATLYDQVADEIRNLIQFNQMIWS